MIISTKAEFSDFLQRWEVEDSFVDVIYCDPEKHPANNKISVIFVNFMKGETYVLPFNHNDCENIGMDVLTQLCKSETHKFCIDKKDILIKLPLRGLVDLKIRKYLTDGDVIERSMWYTAAHKHYYSTSPPANLNSIIPVMKHLESFDSMIRILKLLLQGELNLFYNDKVTHVLSFIESNGLYVSRDKFIGKLKHVTGDSLTFTNYNIFTSTGRPSNAFGGVNYAALGKNDGSRQGFVSRFENGELYQFDYDAFHIRIIANLINYDLPNTSAHEWFAKQYFNTQFVTEEQYNESKKKSFFALYGDDEDSRSIEFFNNTYEFRKKLWKFGNEHGYVPSPISGRKIHLKYIDDVSETKLFNYLLQLLETEHNINVLFNMLNYMKKMKSKLILYTYDSFLFDVHPDEVENMNEIKRMLEDGGKYPVRLETGKTYHSLF